MERFCSQASFYVQELPERLMKQLGGPFTGEFVSWIPGIQGPSQRRQYHELQNGMKLTLFSDGGDQLDATLYAFTPPGGDYVGLSVTIQFSPKIERNFCITLIGTDPVCIDLNVDAKVDIGWFGPKREDEVSHWKQTLARIRQLHSSVKLEVSGFG